MGQQHQPQTGHKSHTQTGASNVEFDLYSEMHSLLKGTTALEQYIEDARQAGDTELATCFQTIKQQNQQNAQQLRNLLAKRITQGASAVGRGA